MKSIATVLMLGCSLGLAGCSGGTGDWYDQSSNAKKVKEERIADLRDQGLTEKQAVGAWWEREVKYNTETGDRAGTVNGQAVSGQELQDALHAQP